MKDTLTSIVVFTVLGQSAFASSDDNVAPTIFEMVSGHWGWLTGPTQCSDGGMEISFSSDHQRMTITYPRAIRQYDGSWISSASYDVLRVDGSGVDLRMDGETRVFEGAPITWRIQLDGDDAFYWEAVEPKRKLGAAEKESWSFGPAEKCR